MAFAGRIHCLNAKSKLFQLEWGLHSAGLALDQSPDIPSMITARDRSVTKIIGDSGGYQVINGKFERPDLFRVRSLQWLEEHCNVGLILDIPTRSIGRPNSKFTSFVQCLDQTEENAKWALDHRRKQGMKLLTVFQGRDEKEATAWFDRMRKLQGFDGIAFAGGTKKDMWLACTRLLDLWQTGELPKQAHLHWLGVGQPGFALMLTGLQRALRKHVDRDITITFDCSTAFSIGGQFKKAVVGVEYDKDAVQFKHYQFPSEPEKMDLSRPFPFRSPIGERIVMNDLMPKTDPYDGAWSHAGTLMLMNHNVYAEVQGIIDANRLMDMGWKLDELIPYQISLAVQAMDKVFGGPKPGQTLKEYKRFLQFYAMSDDSTDDDQR